MCSDIICQTSIKPDDDKEYDTHCQICFLEYSSKNFKTGPEKEESCHMCCKSCFAKIIKKNKKGYLTYKCPWCRVKYIYYNNHLFIPINQPPIALEYALLRIRYRIRLELELKKKQEHIRIRKEKIIMYIIYGFNCVCMGYLTVCVYKIFAAILE